MYIESKVSTIVQPEVAERILRLQRRCISCGSVYALHIHHRIFRSEGEYGLLKLLNHVKPFYENSYKRILTLWNLHSIQNLVVLCKDCHEGEDGRGVHGGNEKLHLILRYSFTCPITGFNIPFIKKQHLVPNF